MRVGWEHSFALLLELNPSFQIVFSIPMISLSIYILLLLLCDFVSTYTQYSPVKIARIDLFDEPDPVYDLNGHLPYRVK